MGFGIQNTDPSVNYSASGLGKYTTIADKIINNAGITNLVAKAAITGLYNGLRNTGLWNKLDHIKVLGLGAIFDSLDWKDPALNAGTRTIFTNDDPAAHTKNGFLADATALRYGDLNFKFKTPVTSLHVHVFNSTSEAASGDHILTGYSQGPSKSAFFISRRFGGTKTTVALSNGAAPQNLSAPVGYDNAKTGMLSLGYQGGNLIMWDGGSRVVQATYTGGTPIVADQASSFNIIGGYKSNATTVALMTTASIQFWAAGVSEWSDFDEANLNALVSAFRAAIQ